MTIEKLEYCNRIALYFGSDGTVERIEEERISEVVEDGATIAITGRGVVELTGTDIPATKAFKSQVAALMSVFDEKRAAVSTEPLM